jgi:glycosyltransferase involved in cell wall biosynthesis
VRISIIIPSYNQAAFLKQAIDSVIAQNYAATELIVIDGGSIDGSVDILRAHNQAISYWVSEPDKGQAHAINKGMQRISGDVWCYLNSDDRLEPGALRRVAEVMQDRSIAWVGGVAEITDASGVIGRVQASHPASLKDYVAPWKRRDKYVFPCSIASFMRTDTIGSLGSLDESYQFCMDIEYYVRAVLRLGLKPRLVPEMLGGWRWHPDSKTMREGLAYGFRMEELRIARTYADCLDATDRAALWAEMREEQRWLVVRWARFLAERGRRAEGLYRLLGASFGDPTLLKFRPWQGALRRSLRGRSRVTVEAGRKGPAAGASTELGCG